MKWNYILWKKNAHLVVTIFTYLLDFDTGEFLFELVQDFRCEWSSSSHDCLEGELLEVKLVDDGVLDQAEHDGRDDGGEVDTVRDESAEEEAELIPLHDHHLALVLDGGAANPDQAVDVEKGYQTKYRHLAYQLRPHTE